jgi:hypothetical protein
MSLLGANIPYMKEVFSLHKVLQVNGFLTLLIMGVGYMIVPRFRNAVLPSSKLAYISLVLVLISVASATTIISRIDENVITMLGTIAQFSGVTIFAALTLWMMRTKPRLLRMADYFIALSLITLVAISLLQLVGYPAGNHLSQIQLWLLFPILMIFGIEYKTLPSFLGFIRPAKKLSVLSLGLAASTVTLGIFSAVYASIALATVFNVMLLGCAITFACSVYIFGGFDNSEILRFIQGEKKMRYVYTLLHSRLAFVFLYAGIAMAALFSNFSNSYILYDLAIHYTAIGFIGITIALYLPLMLPPIIGRMVHFTRFNSIPILLVVTALAMRTGGDIAITTQLASSANYFMMMSGWLVVSALFVFVSMIHRGMEKID